MKNKELEHDIETLSDYEWAEKYSPNPKPFVYAFLLMALVITTIILIII